MKLEEIHNCEECQGKIVSISVDLLGVTRCGYCNKVVDYSRWDNFEMKKFEFVKAQQGVIEK